MPVTEDDAVEVLGAVKRAPNKLAVTGSRAWPDALWWRIWMELHGAELLVFGDCPTGADKWTRRFAEFYRVPFIMHFADWDTHGKSAGSLRNAAIASERPARVVAFAVPGEGNHGTRDCYRKCRQAGAAGHVVQP